MLKKNLQKEWPKDCIWPRPLADGEGEYWEADSVWGMPVDEEIEDMLSVKEYYDDLVEEGKLDSIYQLLNASEDWKPEIGEEYWIDQRFDIELFEDDLSEHLNYLKLPAVSFEKDPTVHIRDLIHYDFVNENLLRQAFTRRSFGREYDVGDCEQLELIGDSILNMIVTKMIAEQLCMTDNDDTCRPFRTKYDEGELTRIRTYFINKEYLASRAKEHGLDQFILYGKDEQPSDDSLEDTMEALIGAVATDSGWDWKVLEDVADSLLCIQLTDPDRFLKATHYELVNRWHQKHFGVLPEYEIENGHRGSDRFYYCTLRFMYRDHKENIIRSHRIDTDGETRSAARESAAMRAYAFLVSRGLWISLEDAGVIPSLDNSINQLQELMQKGYVSKPEYEFEEWDRDQWHCSCVCSGINGYGKGLNKTNAKKKAAYMVLVRLLKAAGICKEEWEDVMWQL